MKIECLDYLGSGRAWHLRCTGNGQEAGLYIRDTIVHTLGLWEFGNTLIAPLVVDLRCNNKLSRDDHTLWTDRRMRLVQDGL